MQISRFGWIASVVALVGSGGCVVSKNASEKGPVPESSIAPVCPVNLQFHIRDNCASLLYDLLSDEKNLGKILIIKRESDSLHQLVKQISETSRRGARQLEQLAETDRTLHLQAPGLPSGDAATREAEAETKKNQLLHSKGAEFEFKLLLTQTEALSYGAHLAKVAAQNEPRPENARVFSNIQSELEKLYEQVCVELRHDHGPAPPAGKEK
jgi:hypothetical protein